jgi:hypothetical protein
MSHHTPKQPSPNILRRLRELTIDVVNGKVYNWDGRELGSRYKDGRIQIGISTGSGVFEEYRQIRRAHIIWWKAKGYWPRMTIDHKDIDCANDCIDNLREATMTEQNNNRTVSCNYDASSDQNLT